MELHQLMNRYEDKEYAEWLSQRNKEKSNAKEFYTGAMSQCANAGKVTPK